MNCACGCRLSSPITLVALAVSAALLVTAAFVNQDDASDLSSGVVRPAAETKPMSNAKAENAASQHESIPAGFAPTEFFTPTTDPTTLKMAMFGGGCFWGVEAYFRSVEGVTHSAVGFSGGEVQEPSYVEVCKEDTGHAEVVALLFDPSKVTYAELLDVFWKIHDPTQVNRQGPDVGEQYRSVIFAYGEDQTNEALASRKAFQKKGKYGGREIATKIEPAGPYYLAEDYHQQYLAKRGLDNCHVPNN